MNDAEIISLLFERSEQGLREIESCYGRKMKGLAVNICANASDAEEVINDALRAVWERIPPERPDPFSTWLLRIVRNLSYKKIRYRSALKRSAEVLPLDELAEELPASDGGPASDSGQISEEINRFLRSLAETDRIIFVRRFWYSDSVADIAASSGLSRGAVSARLSRMRKSLAAHLELRGVRV